MSNLAQHIPTFNPTASAKQCFCGLLLPQEARPILQPDPKWKLGEQMSQQDRQCISTARKKLNFSLFHELRRESHRLNDIGSYLHGTIMESIMVSHDCTYRHF